MISAMNTDNLSCTFCFRNMINMLLPATARQGTLLWTKGYPIDKRAILWTKETSPQHLEAEISLSSRNIMNML